jgi:hypothetical protein
MLLLFYLPSTMSSLWFDIIARVQWEDRIFLIIAFNFRQRDLFFT